MTSHSDPDVHPLGEVPEEILAVPAERDDSETAEATAVEYGLSAWKLAHDDGRPLIIREALAIVLLLLADSDAARQAMAPHLRSLMGQAFETWP